MQIEYKKDFFNHTIIISELSHDDNIKMSKQSKFESYKYSNIFNYSFSEKMFTKPNKLEELVSFLKNNNYSESMIQQIIAFKKALKPKLIRNKIIKLSLFFVSLAYSIYGLQTNTNSILLIPSWCIVVLLLVLGSMKYLSEEDTLLDKLTNYLNKLMSPTYIFKDNKITKKK